MNNIFKSARRVLLCRWYNRKFKSIGRNFRWDPASSHFGSPGTAEIGDNVFITDGAHISVAGSLKIGDGALIGPRVIILGGDHETTVIGKRLYELKEGKNYPMTIGKDVWIGAGVIILKAVNIGEGAIIGAGSLVTRDIPPYTVAVGHPARPVKKRFSDDDLVRHLELPDYDRETIDGLIDARNRGLV